MPEIWTRAESSYRLATVDEENNTGGSARPPLPVREITVNQVIAWNLAWYRKQAGLKQADLGERIGWTGSAVSEAERSWDGKRTREFDAHTIVTLAAALGIPVLALFLPPLDDGADARFLFTVADGDCGEKWDMGDLMSLVMPDSHDDTAVMVKYRTRLTFDVERYMDTGWAKDLARWLRPLEPREIREARVKRLRAQQYTLADAAAELGELADEISAGLDDEEDGQ